jgi:hypothetical protein
MQNSISFRKPNDKDGYQLIKSGSTLLLQYYSSSIFPESSSVDFNINGNITAVYFTGSLFGTASYADTASIALNGGVTQLVAGPNISLSPSSGVGQVTITSAGGGIGGNTTTGSYGSFYDTGSYPITSTTEAYSASLGTTYISNGVYISGSNGDKTKVYFTNAGVYNYQFSAQFSNNSGQNEIVNIWIRKGNDGGSSSDIAYTNSQFVIPQKTGGADGELITSLNYYINAATGDYVQLMYQAESTTVTLKTNPANTTPTTPVSPCLIVTANRIDQFMSNTGSFLGTFTGDLIGTSSYSTTASYALNVSTIDTGSLVTTSSFNAYTGSNSSKFAGTSSYAVSSSNFIITNTLQLDGTLTDYSNIASSIVGTNNIYTQATGSYTAAFTKYTLFNGLNARAGEFMTVWNDGLGTTYTDVSTTDLGDTSPVTFTSTIITGQIQINAVTLTSGWTIKTLVTYI